MRFIIGSLVNRQTSGRITLPLVNRKSDRVIIANRFADHLQTQLLTWESYCQATKPILVVEILVEASVAACFHWMPYERKNASLKEKSKKGTSQFPVNRSQCRSALNQLFDGRSEGTDPLFAFLSNLRGMQTFFSFRRWRRWRNSL